MRRALPLALLLAACGGGGAPDGPVRIDERDRAFGAEQHERLLAEFGGAYGGDEAPYVAAVGERVAEAAGLGGECVVTLVNSDVVNAFAVPGCYVYVTRGLLALVGSEDELASVLGHELGHVVAAHSARRERRSMWRHLGVLAVSLVGSERLTRLAGQAAQYFTLRYSRAQEYESDTLGLRYMVAAGYDPHAAADMLGALGRHEAYMTSTGGRDEARSIPEWARSHPLAEARVERARAAAAATGIADEERPERVEPYLATVDGLLYGDDPEQGFVLGRRFAHPLLRIGFEAPEGYTLTNSPQAIQLSGPGGVRGEFAGGPLPPGGLPEYAARVASAITGGKGEAVAAERVAVDGRPFVLLRMALRGRQGAATLSVAAYDGGGGGAYHFVLLSPAGADGGDALFETFHLLTPAEIARLRPRVLRTVEVAPGGAPAMADPNGRELFGLLNGRNPAAPLRPGERVKIVTWAR